MKTRKKHFKLSLMLLFCSVVAISQASADRNLTRKEKQQIQDIRQELIRLAGSDEKVLEQKADKGNRFAAYLLGRRFQMEAMRLKNNPVLSANAFAEAAYWLSASARIRPQSQNSANASRVDQAPALPLRAVRSVPGGR